VRSLLDESTGLEFLPQSMKGSADTRDTVRVSITTSISFDVAITPRIHLSYRDPIDLLGILRRIDAETCRDEGKLLLAVLACPNAADSHHFSLHLLKATIRASSSLVNTVERGSFGPIGAPCTAVQCSHLENGLRIDCIAGSELSAGWGSPLRPN
jgi:hypothetical protein